MGKFGPIKILFLLLIAAVILIPSCHKDQFNWKPDAVLIMKPDSGLTTQTFDFRINMLNLPPSQEEFYIRWDLNGDSIWDASFSSQPTVSYRLYQKGVHMVRAEILTEDGQRFTLQHPIRIDQGYSAPHAIFSVDPPEGIIAL